MAWSEQRTLVAALGVALIITAALHYQVRTLGPLHYVSGPPIGSKASNFTLRATDGEAYDLLSYSGRSSVMLVFGDCQDQTVHDWVKSVMEVTSRPETPALSVLLVQLPNLDERREVLCSNLGVPLLLDTEGSTIFHYDVRTVAETLPTAVLIDRTGFVVQNFSGFLPALDSEFWALIKQL